MDNVKRAQVIMLPTENKSSIWSQRWGKICYNKKTIEHIQDENKYNLYVISNDNIKNGDWCYDKTNNRIVNFIYLVEGTKNHCFVSSIIGNEKEIAKSSYSLDKTDLQKIIATTDTSLKISIDEYYNTSSHGRVYYTKELPQPSQQFIEKYIESYNKGEVIDDVLVEYEEINIGLNLTRGIKYLVNTFENKLKINPKDNTITIKKLKDSWNRKEIRGLLIKFHNEFPERYNLEQWIKENL